MYAKNVLERISPKGKDSLLFSWVIEQQLTLQPKYNLKDMFKNNNLRNFSMASSAYINCGKSSLKKGKENFVLQKFHFLKFSKSMWWDGHVGVQNNGKMSLKFCIIIESNSQETFFAIVLYTNMAAVTSRVNREMVRRFGLRMKTKKWRWVKVSIFFLCLLFQPLPAKHPNAIQSRLEMAICGLWQKWNDKFAHCMDFISVDS